jgi:hypothetical protein
MSLNLQAKPYVSSSVIMQSVDDQHLLVSPTVGKVRVINDLGGQIWLLLDGKRTVADLITILQARYAVDITVLTQDVTRFLAELQQRDLIGGL